MSVSLAPAAATITAAVEAVEEELVELRHHVHAHPELAWEEERTTALVTHLKGGQRSSALTSREIEVATLVAEGLTNRQIADRLVISERTAQNHVQHILTKLGFSTRSQIAAWMSRSDG